MKRNVHNRIVIFNLINFFFVQEIFFNYLLDVCSEIFSLK